MNKPKKPAILAPVFVAAAVFASTAWSAGDGQGGASPKAATGGASAAAAATAELTQAEVKKVDKEAGKVTLKHGEIHSLGMPAMTMVFKAKDPKMLESLKPGDKVRFAAEKAEGSIVVTRIEAAQ